MTVDARQVEVELDVVEVWWLDSVQLEGGGWMRLEDVDDVECSAPAVRHRSVGYLVRETVDVVALARSVTDYHEAGRDVHVPKVEGVLLIPAAAIVGRRLLAGRERGRV